MTGANEAATRLVTTKAELIRRLDAAIATAAQAADGRLARGDFAAANLAAMAADTLANTRETVQGFWPYDHDEGSST